MFFASKTLVDCSHTWVLLVEPRSLHISLLLWVVVLGVNFTHQVRDLLDAHLLEGSGLTASIFVLHLLEVSHSLTSGHHLLLSIVVSVLSVEVASILIGPVSWDNCSKARIGGLHRSVHEGQLSDVVLVDHPKDWLLLLHVDLGVLHPLLVDG